jgi:hypothetical protein
VIVVGVVWAFLLPELPLRAKSAMSDRLAGTPSAAEPAAH